MMQVEHYELLNLVTCDRSWLETFPDESWLKTYRDVRLMHELYIGFWLEICSLCVDEIVC